MSAQYRIKGISEEITTCDQCGKRNLKKTIILATDEGGELFFGSDCAAAAIIGSKSQTNNKIMQAWAQAAALASKWIKIYGAHKTADAISGRFGYPTSTKDGRLYIYFKKGEATLIE